MWFFSGSSEAHAARKGASGRIKYYQDIIKKALRRFKKADYESIVTKELKMILSLRSNISKLKMSMNKGKLRQRLISDSIIKILLI